MRIVNPFGTRWKRPGLGSGDAPVLASIDPWTSPADLYREKRMKILTLEQSTPEWLGWRQTGIGASEAPAVAGIDPWTTRVELYRRKVGLLSAVEENDHMRRGKRLEPKARACYERLFDWPMPAACVLHDEYRWLKASLDGLRADHKLVLELKAPGSRGHEEVLGGHVPDHYYCQVQHQLLITGSPLCHFCSYNESFPPGQHFALVTIQADAEYQRSLLELLKEFWQCVLEGVEPD
jgi:putative phage-type endonuclease